MNTRRLPTRAAAKQRVTSVEEKGGVTMDSATKLPATNRVNEKNDVSNVKQKNDAKNLVATRASYRTPKSAGRNHSERDGSDTNNTEPVLPKVLKNDDDQTATTCTETPATEEKSGRAMKEPVSRADFHPMNPSSGGKPPDSFKQGMPPLENAAFGYPSYPAPPPLHYGPPPGNVPPTVHMPFSVSNMSPLQIHHPLKNGENSAEEHKKNDLPSSNPVTPRQAASAKESEAALAMLGCATKEKSPAKDVKSSPLGLLSSVLSSSPTGKAKKVALDATLPPLQAGVAAPPFKYPPPPEQMDLNNFHCFPQVPQSDLKFSQTDEYPLPLISATFGLDDDFNPDTPSSRHATLLQSHTLLLSSSP